MINDRGWKESKGNEHSNICVTAGAASEETNQRSSSAHNRHSLTKGKQSSDRSPRNVEKERIDVERIRSIISNTQPPADAMSLFIVLVCAQVTRISRQLCALHACSSIYTYIYIFLNVWIAKKVLLVSHVGGKVSSRFPFVAEASGKCFCCERYRRTTATNHPFSLISSCKFVNKRNRSFPNIKEAGIKLTLVIPY